MKSLISSLIGLVLSVSAGAEPLLEGRVRLESGEPVADAQVRIFDLSDLRQGPVARAQTDGTGYFALPLAALTGSALPTRFTLGQNYPNPFNPSTIIPYHLAASSEVQLEVFNLLGQHIATLVDGERSAGFHTATWHATDAAGRAVGAGVYVYRMTVGVESQTGRMVLIDGQAGVSAGGMASVWPGVSGGSGSDGGDAQVYGLVVSGSGLAPYVDSAFRVESGMAPVELVVSAGLPSAGKVADDDCAFCDFFGGINYAEETDSTSNQRGPDLIVESLSLVGSASVSPGGTLTLLATVRNQGDSLATATTLHYYRSTDATISTQDTGVGTDAVDALAVAGTSAKLIRLTTPSSEGTYYYGACVASVAGESNTNNNCSSSRVVRIWSESSPATIPDANLRAAIAAVLGKASGETITKDEMETLRRLEAEDAGISDLTGLEFATNLTWLSLNDNNLTDVSALAGLTKLEVLNLSGNQITDISALAGLIRLWWLGLSGNTITDIAALAGLTNLRVLYIGYNQITDVSALAGLTKLTHLYLWNNRITDVSALAGLTKLIELFLNDNPLSVSSINDHIPILQARGVAVTFDPIDPTPATIPDANLRAAIAAALGKASGETITKGEMTTLVRLDAKDADISDLTGLGFATKLEMLDLSANQITDISALKRLTKLETLGLDGNQITDISALARLTKLKELRLNDNPLSAASINDHIPALQARGVTVTFDPTPVTIIPDAKLRAAIAAALGKASGATITKGEIETLLRLEAEDAGISDLTGLELATNLTWLSLNDNNLTAVSALTGLTKLEVLNLSGNQITDISALTGLTRLWWLGLSGNTITDIAALAGLTNLRVLYIGNNQITDVSALAGLTKLTHLYLWNNRITDVSALAGSTKLTELHLNGNPLSASSINDHIPTLQDRGVAVEFDPTPVTIVPDAKLRAAIAAALGKASDATITKDEISTLLRLDAENAGISDLTGLEFAINLTWLGLSGNQITNLSALADLTNLETLNLLDNQITNLSALAGLTKLRNLYLGNNQITNLSALADLTNLRNLYLWNNQIADVSALAGLTNLRNLRLNDNPLSASSINDHIPALQDRGVRVTFEPTPETITDAHIPATIPDSWLRVAIAAALGKAKSATITKGEMSTLVRLDEKNAGISDLTGLEFAINLENLKLYGNQITDVSALEGLTKLTWLELSVNQITDVSALEGLTNLETLKLSDNQIMDVSALSRLTNLETLILSVNQITDVSALEGLTKLKELYLSVNQIADVSALEGLTKLKELYLSVNQIADVSALEGLTNLETLSLSDNQITDMSALQGLTNLRILRLNDNPLSASSINDHIPALQARGVTVYAPDPTPVTISDANLRAAIAAALGKARGATITKGEMEALRRLEANEAGISDLTGLEFATNLRTLSLSYNQITDVSALSRLTKLETLSLSGNNLTDISPLAGLTKLTWLELAFNNISDVSSLQDLTNLTELGLRANPLSASTINNHISALKDSGTTVSFDPPFRESDFDIELVFLDDHFTEKHKQVIRHAARRWMSIIREDLPDYTLTQGWSGNCGDHSYRIPAGERIDDLRIYVSGRDLPDNLAGRGGPDVLRTTDLPVVGCVEFDLEWAKSSSLLYFLQVGLHEIGHVLGIGTIWDAFVQNPSGDTYFNGPRAIAAFDDAGGRDYAGAKVPVETDSSHWRASELSGELMRAKGSGDALSAITIQALADLGWVVDVTQADPYTLPDAAAKASAKIAAPPTHAEPEFSCGTGQHQEPIYVVDPQGRIVRTISP